MEISQESISKQRDRRVKAATEEIYDICIIGGGVHGAWMARDAAIRGLKVLLLEANDYASATSSRSSKMLHGGVRYLERGDVKLVFEALRERERCLKIAPHLCCKQEFLYPIIKGETRPSWQVRIGLGAYDFLARLGTSTKLFPRHRPVSESETIHQRLKKLGLVFQRLLEYSDGQMNDARIVLEAVIDAESLGANCLNYAKVIEAKKGSNWELKFVADKKEFTCKAKVVINAAGPWVGELAKGFSAKRTDLPQVIWSRGIHLLFSEPWEGPGLIIPTGEKGRYYFIWPHFLPGSNSTLVGTTDQQTKVLDSDPKATEAEIEQLLGYLKRDLPDSALAKAKPYQTFCGVRTLASKSKKSDGLASKLSRTEIWVEADDMLHLVGGKFTNARATAEKGIDKAQSLLNAEPVSEQVRQELQNRPLPGSQNFNEKALLEEINTGLQAKLPSFDTDYIYSRAVGLVGRFGSKSRDVLALVEEKSEKASDIGCLRAEVKYTLIKEQAITIEDVVFRRLNLGYLPVDLDECQQEIARLISGQ